MNKQEIEETIAILKSMIPVYEMQRKTFGVNALKSAISSLQQQLTNGWIPVSERLPERGVMDITGLDYQSYTCTMKIGVYPTKVASCCFSKDGHWVWGNSNFDDYIIAWQPLPEPYKEGKDERN